MTRQSIAAEPELARAAASVQMLPIRRHLPQVLVIDDNRGDALLVRIALQGGKSTG